MKYKLLSLTFLFCTPMASQAASGSLDITLIKNKATANGNVKAIQTMDGSGNRNNAGVIAVQPSHSLTARYLLVGNKATSNGDVTAEQSGNGHGNDNVAGVITVQ